jgi:hypothetical protein
MAWHGKSLTKWHGMDLHVKHLPRNLTQHSFRTQGQGCFYRINQPRVLWTGVLQNEQVLTRKVGYGHDMKSSAVLKWYKYQYIRLHHSSIQPYKPLHAFTSLYMPLHALHANTCLTCLYMPYMPLHALHAFTCLYMPLHAFTCLTCLYMPLHAFTCLNMPLHAFTCYLILHVPMVSK